MSLPLNPAARAALFLLSLGLAALLLVPNVRGYGAHRLALAAAEHQEWGRLEAAGAAVQVALRLTPQDAELYRTLGDLEAARFRWRKDPAAQEAALAAYATATALNPLDGRLYAAYAEELMRAGRFGSAHAALTSALERDPNNALYHTLRGRLAEAEGGLEGAIKAYRRAEAIQPNAERGARLEELLTRGE